MILETKRHHVDIAVNDIRHLSKVKELQKQSNIDGMSYYCDGNNTESRPDKMGREYYRDLMLKRKISKPIKFSDIVENILGDQ